MNCLLKLMDSKQRIREY